ncbi:uncharacterized protein [Watersipora subatra]|uniref:uncharacterized protein n=1 Tax=Watersipora subatra TaxID=2589382 RepID=UPI00355B64D6
MADPCAQAKRLLEDYVQSAGRRKINLTELKQSFRRISEAQLLQILAEISQGCNIGNPVHLAAREGDFNLIQVMVEFVHTRKERGELFNAVSKFGDGVIHFASVGGNVDIIDYIGELLPAEQMVQLLQLQSHRGDTAMHLASEHGCTSVIKSILKRCSRRDAKKMLKLRNCSGETVIHCAVESNKLEVIEEVMEFLLSNLSTEDILDILKVENNNGYTALMLGAQAGYIQSVKRLLERLPSNTQRLELLQLSNRDRKTAETLAAENGHEDVVAYLQSHKLPPKPMTKPKPDTKPKPVTKPKPATKFKPVTKPKPVIQPKPIAQASVKASGETSQEKPKLKKMHDMFSKKITELEDRQEVVRKRKSEYQETSAKAAERIAQLQKALEKSESEKDVISDKRDAAEIKCKELETELLKKDQTIKKCEKKIRKLNDTNEDLFFIRKRMIERQQHSLASEDQSDLQDLFNQLDNTRAEQEKSASQLENAKQELEQCKEELEQLETKTGHTKQEKRKLERRREECEKKVIILQQQKEEIEQKIEKFRESISATFSASSTASALPSPSLPTVSTVATQPTDAFAGEPSSVALQPSQETEDDVSNNDAVFAQFTDEVEQIDEFVKGIDEFMREIDDHGTANINMDESGAVCPIEKNIDDESKEKIQGKKFQEYTPEKEKITGRYTGGTHDAEDSDRGSLIERRSDEFHGNVPEKETIEENKKEINVSRSGRTHGAPLWRCESCGSFSVKQVPG